MAAVKRARRGVGEQQWESYAVSFQGELKDGSVASVPDAVADDVLRCGLAVVAMRTAIAAAACQSLLK